MAQTMMEEELGACKANTIVGAGDNRCLARKVEITGDILRFGVDLGLDEKLGR